MRLPYHLIKKSTWIILVILIFSKFSVGQTYTYTRQPVQFDKVGDKFYLIDIDNNFHLWKISKDETSFSVFDRNMRLINSINFPKKLNQLITFVKFTNSYLLFLSDDKLLHTFQIDKSGNVKERTKEIKSKSIENATGFFFAQKKNDLIYLIQSLPSEKNSSAYGLISIDSNLNLVARTSIILENESRKNYTINFFPGNDSIIYFVRHSHEYKKPSTLLFAKINTRTEAVLAETFSSKDTNYLFSSLLEDIDQNIVLHNRLSLKERQPHQALFNSQFIRFNKNFEMTKSEFFDTFSINDSLSLSESGFLPTKTVPLNNSGFLSISYGISAPSLTEVVASGGMSIASRTSHNKPDYLRIIYFDSSLTIKKRFYKKSIKGEYYPSFVLSSGTNSIFFYNKTIDRKWTSLHGYQITDTLENKFELRVVPSYTYYLTRSLQINGNTLVIPYINNRELGLVKISLNNSE